MSMALKIFSQYRCVMVLAEDFICYYDICACENESECRMYMQSVISV